MTTEHELNVTCARACVRVCVCVCVRACVRVFFLFALDMASELRGSNIGPKFIMQTKQNSEQLTTRDNAIHSEHGGLQGDNIDRFHAKRLLGVSVSDFPAKGARVERQHIHHVAIQVLLRKAV